MVYLLVSLLLFVYLSVLFQRSLNEYYFSFALDAVLGREIRGERLSLCIHFCYCFQSMNNDDVAVAVSFFIV